MSTSFAIAKRFLRSSRNQTIMIVLGIAIGISVQVFVGTLIQSLQATLLDATVGSSSHVTVYPEEGKDGIVNWQADLSTIEKVDGVMHVTPVYSSNTLASAAGNKTFPVLIRGFDLDRAEGIYKISEHLVSGSKPGINEILIGKDNQMHYGLSIGDSLRLVLANSSSQVKISGFFDFKIKVIDTGWGLTSLSTAQAIFGHKDSVTSIEMQVTDVFAADTIAMKVKDALPAGLKVTNWKDDNADLLQGLSAQSSSSYMIQVFVIASVVIAIASILAISVVQKSRQIGILKAMGITDRAASMIFLYQGLILGIAGGISGVLLGLFLFSGFLFGSGLIQPHIDWVFVIGSGAMAIIASCFAALIPARRSSRLDPVEVIRSG
jgi:lipoprotein-releasing system permease protein